MEKTNRSIMLAAPAAVVAFMLAFAVPGTALLGTQSSTTDSVGPHGYVTVSVMRDGQEVYHHEDHNDITVDGRDFIAQQIGQTTGIATNGANFIALTTTDITPSGLVAAGSVLTGEISSGGLARAQGTYAHTNDAATFTITRTFTASATHTNIQGGGLFNAAVTGSPGAGGDDGTMVAVNEFTPVTLQNNDQLTITWTITLS
jgi:hypothetical protein